jgi:hypothetical protein
MVTSGGEVGHNGKRIDSKHKHDGVKAGGDMTGFPIIPSTAVVAAAVVARRLRATAAVAVPCNSKDQTMPK